MSLEAISHFPPRQVGALFALRQSSACLKTFKKPPYSVERIHQVKARPPSSCDSSSVVELGLLLASLSFSSSNIHSVGLSFTYGFLQPPCQVKGRKLLTAVSMNNEQNQK
jgi:hypothetical protein